MSATSGEELDDCRGREDLPPSMIGGMRLGDSVAADEPEAEEEETVEASGDWTPKMVSSEWTNPDGVRCFNVDRWSGPRGQHWRRG